MKGFLSLKRRVEVQALWVGTPDGEALNYPATPWQKCCVQASDASKRPVFSSESPESQGKRRVSEAFAFNFHVKGWIYEPDGPKPMVLQKVEVHVSTQGPKVPG